MVLPLAELRHRSSARPWTAALRLAHGRGPSASMSKGYYFFDSHSLRRVGPVFMFFTSSPMTENFSQDLEKLFPSGDPGRCTDLRRILTRQIIIPPPERSSGPSLWTRSLRAAVY